MKHVCEFCGSIAIIHDPVAIPRRKCGTMEHVNDEGDLVMVQTPLCIKRQVAILQNTVARQQERINTLQERPDAFDAGLLGGDRGWSVEQWHDYIRSLLDAAEEHYQQRVEA